MDFAVNVPLNSVSFGQVSMAWLREIQTRSLEPSIFPIGGQVDLSSQEIDKPLQEWLQNCINKSLSGHDRKIPTIKLWHLNGSLESFSEKQVLFLFMRWTNPPHKKLILPEITLPFLARSILVMLLGLRGWTVIMFRLGSIVTISKEQIKNILQTAG